MESHPIRNPEAATDEPAFVSTMVSDALGNSVTESSRSRHDGWTPERMAGFLRALAACGVVADACRSVGMSAQSAYALRNRRAGRAFATAWDAALIHRARVRLGDELMSRALNGCVEAVHRDGAVVGERHRYDNRLSMAVLTRLDRLAERAGDDAETLRAVSEDLDDFLDCLEQGADAEAFVEERKPAKPQPAPPPPVNSVPSDDFDRLARLAGCPDWRDVTPFDIPINDLDPDQQQDWGTEGWVRAGRSYYLDWLDMQDRAGTRPFGEDCAAAFDRARKEVRETMFGSDRGDAETQQEGPPVEPSQPSTSSTSHLPAEEAQ